MTATIAPSPKESFSTGRATGRAADFQRAGGLSERVLPRAPPGTDRYIGPCRDLGVGSIGWSSRVTTWLGDDWRWLVERIQRAGLKSHIAFLECLPAGIWSNCRSWEPGGRIG